MIIYIYSIINFLRILYNQIYQHKYYKYTQTIELKIWVKMEIKIYLFIIVWHYLLYYMSYFLYIRYYPLYSFVYFLLFMNRIYTIYVIYFIMYIRSLCIIYYNYNPRSSKLLLKNIFCYIYKIKKN